MVVVLLLVVVAKVAVKLLVMQLVLISAQVIAYRIVAETALRVVLVNANQVAQELQVLLYLNL